MFSNLKKVSTILAAAMMLTSSIAIASPNHANHNPIFQKDWKFIASIKAKVFKPVFEKLHHLEIDIAGVNMKTNEIDVLINDYDYKNLVKEGIELKIREVKGISKGPDEEYRNPEEIEQLTLDFANKFPNLTKRISIGKSVEGRDIWAVKISDNADIDESSEPAVLFNSMHHAREVMGPEVAIDIMETLLSGYGNDTQITKWVDSYEIWVMPMFNVDGNNKMWTKDKWWRKNNQGGYGVDLNRNYPSGWNKCNGSSGWRSSQTYRGPDPASEPETQAMMNFIANVRPVFDISYHSYSELVIYPFGCSPERTPTQEVVEKIGKEIGKKLNYTAGTAWELLYNADGGDIDWMYDAYQVIPFVIELNSNKEGFQPSYAKWRDKTVIKNRAGWQHLLTRLEESGVRGQFTMNKAIVSDFKVEILNSGQTESFQSYVGHKTGMYHLVLNPGDYDLHFVVADKIIAKERISIGAKLQTLDISL